MLKVIYRGNKSIDQSRAKNLMSWVEFKNLRPKAGVFTKSVTCPRGRLPAKLMAQPRRELRSQTSSLKLRTGRVAASSFSAEY